jgi:hypothetical protein
LLEALEQNRDIGRIILQIAIHGYNHVARSLAQPAQERSALTAVTGVAEASNPRMEASRLLDRLPSAIRAAVVNEKCSQILDFSLYCCQLMSQW